SGRGRGGDHGAHGAGHARRRGRPVLMWRPRRFVACCTHAPFWLRGPLGRPGARRAGDGHRRRRGTAGRARRARCGRRLGGGGGGGGGAGGGGGRPAPDVHAVRAADLKPGDLSSLTAPSLFGGGGLVVVRWVQDAGKDVAAELARYAAAPAPDVALVLTHSGGAKNKSLLASLAGGGARGVDWPPGMRLGGRL